VSAESTARASTSCPGAWTGYHGFRFTLEARAALGVVCHRGRKNLDGHVSVEPRVGGAIHLAHPARAERRDDGLGAEMGAGSERQTAYRFFPFPN
jgi:hypothetical protein